MPQLVVPIVRTAALPAGYCWPEDPEVFFEAIVARIQGQFLNNLNGVIISPTPPGADDRDKLWFNTNNQDNELYRWITTGYTGWARKHLFPAGSAKRIWFPLDTDLATEDGGAAGAIGDATGPFWIEDTAFAGRFPLARGVIPGTTPPVTVAAGDTGGAYQVMLTDKQGATSSHVHAFGQSNNAGGSSGDDAFFCQVGKQTVQGYQGTYITGSNGVIVSPQTTADLFTLPPGLDGKGVTAPDPVILMNPYIVGLWARRSARIWVLPI